MREQANRRQLEPQAYRLACALIVLLAFALRVRGLSARALWLDEAMEYWVASSPLPSLAGAVREGIQDPPLYSVLLHLWMGIGQHEFVLRFLSLLLSILGMLGTMTLARVALGTTPGSIAGLLIAISPPHVRFAQEAGQYALMECLLAWNLVFLYRSLRTTAWKWVTPWGATLVLTCYSYYGAWLIVAAAACLAVVHSLLRQGRRSSFRLAVAGAICLVLVLPLAFAWLPAQLLRGPTAEAFHATFRGTRVELLDFAQRSGQLLLYQATGTQPDGWPWTNVPAWLVWLPVLALLALGMGAPGSDPHLRAWLGACFLLYYAIGRLGAYPFEGRYSFILTPLWTCVLAAGIAQVAQRYRAGAVVSLGILVLVAALAPPDPQEDLRSVARRWLSRRHPGEATYVYYGAVPGFRYQLLLAGASGSAPPTWYLGCWAGEPLPACAEGGIYYGEWIRPFSPEEKRTSILGALGSAPDRLWLVFSHIYAGEDAVIVDALGDRYRVTESHSAQNAALFLLERAHGRMPGP